MQNRITAVIAVALGLVAGMAVADLSARDALAPAEAVLR